MEQKKLKNNTCTKEIFKVGLKKLHPNQGIQPTVERRNQRLAAAGQSDLYGVQYG